uniref:Uncharacterized protein n=1 Tax=Parascaris univalens TaxID=6257 RepID=A0A914ZL16_PARUN
ALVFRRDYSLHIALKAYLAPETRYVQRSAFSSFISPLSLVRLSAAGQYASERTSLPSSANVHHTTQIVSTTVDTHGSQSFKTAVKSVNENDCLVLLRTLSHCFQRGVIPLDPYTQARWK